MDSVLNHIDDERLLGLVAQYGTPLFVYDLDMVESAYQRLYQGIEHRPLQIFFSIKANSLVALASHLNSLGCGADVCSPADIMVADMAGVPPSKRSYIGYGISEMEVAAACEHCGVFIADSISQIALAARYSPSRAIGLRIRSMSAGAFAGDSSYNKFGILPDEVCEALHRARLEDLTVIGLHAHLGRTILSSKIYGELLSELLETAAQYKLNLRWVSLGGGLPSASDDPEGNFSIGCLNEALKSGLRSSYARSLHGLELRLEPGSYLAMDCGALLTQVTDLKHRVTKLVERHVAVDASTNQLPSAQGSGALHPLRLVPRGRPGNEARWDVAGNLMAADDFLALDRNLPPLNVGDLLAFGRCGAYSSSRTALFNGRPRPAEVVLRGGIDYLARRRETAADLISRDLIGWC